MTAPPSRPGPRTTGASRASRLEPDRADPGGPSADELRLAELVRALDARRARRVGFDLGAFSTALEHHDVGYQLACYAPGADIRVIDPESPPSAARVIRGSRAIRSWLDNSGALDVEVTHLVDGGDRVAFTERWHQRDATLVVATSTAELQDGLITTQHTIVAWTPVPFTRRHRPMWFDGERRR